MSRNFVFYISNLIKSLESGFSNFFPQNSALPLAVVPGTFSDRVRQNDQSAQRSIKDLIGDCILWAVPKSRRTIEKRLKRKYGSPQYGMKLLRVKSHLRACIQCGNDHEAGVLCPHCYNRVREETKQMQDQIQEQLGLNPVEEDVVVLYHGERSEQPSETFNGKRIVEMPKPRPLWFTKNLLQKTTQEPSDSKQVKPVDLA